NIGALKAQTLSRPHGSLYLQRMIVRFAGVRVEIGLVKLRVGRNPVLWEQPGGNGRRPIDCKSTRHIDTFVCSTEHRAAFPGHTWNSAGSTGPDSVKDIERVRKRRIVAVSQSSSEGGTQP